MECVVNLMFDDDIPSADQIFRIKQIAEECHFVVEINNESKNLCDSNICHIHIFPLKEFSDIETFVKNENLDYPTIYIRLYDYLSKADPMDEVLSYARWLRYVDSSIWRYFCEMNIEIDGQGNKQLSREDENKFKKALMSIRDNYSKGIYNLAIAHEYNDLQHRLLEQDYIKSKGDHANISPFLFHMESKMMERLLNYEFLFIGKQWRILLLDDRSGKFQKGCQSLTNYDETPSKLYQEDIIECRLNNLYEKIKIANDISPITTECVQSIEQAKKRLQEYCYDIILLDYKLGENEKGAYSYGYEILTAIRDNKALQEKARPNGKYFFMFTSAYPTAVQERLRCEDLSTSEKYWFIGRGANPTNTPYLFLYSLCRLMRVRYETLTEHAEQLLRKLKENEADVKNAEIDNYTSMSQFLTLLYQDGNERNNCVVGFNAFLNLRRVYNTVKYDIDEKEPDKGSPLINSLFPDVVVCTNSFWEHLQNLVYLTAYGTIRQWPEMWEDYTFVKQKLEAAEKLCKDRINGEPASVLIRNYILKLKESMS